MTYESSPRRTHRATSGNEELFAAELKRRAQEAQSAKSAKSDLDTPTPVTPVPVVRLQPPVDAVAAEVKPLVESPPQPEPVAPAKAEPAADRDDTSIPPVLVAVKADADDDHHDEDADRFFAEGERSAHSISAVITAEEPEAPNAELMWRFSPAARERRSRYTKIAQRVIGALAVVALVGLGKAALTHAPSADLPLRALANAAEPIAKAEEPKAEPKPEPKIEAKAEEHAAPAPTAEAPKTEPTPEAAAANAAPAAAAPATEGEAAPDPSTDPKADKKAAQHALDRGDNKTAIEMGERSLQADPTDGETWLIVGAAYQSIGQNAKAHQAFASCVQKAKKGPVGECAALR
jgi:hypothetical protein